MRWIKKACLLVLLMGLHSGVVLASETQTLKTSGLIEPVEIIKDNWGISHIYAQNQPDLFFAQGYNAARDRLFQFEIWRRKALGTLSEIQGEKALDHDIGARLLRFRGDINAEMAHYHEDGIEIITSFVRGVNAYIMETEKNPDLLPFEFKMLGIKPGHWTPEIVVSRHNALTGGVNNEIMLSKVISAIGEETTRKVLPFYRDAHLRPMGDIDLSKIKDEIFAAYRASRSMPAFDLSDLKVKKKAFLDPLNANDWDPMEEYLKDPIMAVNSIGSNNWVVAGSHTDSGMPIMANDPHRAIQSPSLRYWAHLNAPGWNVIGGGEPVLPGISIGHNEHGAWGLTIFAIDQEDLYVYKTNPQNANQYWYKGAWKDMEVEETSINVRDAGVHKATLKYSVHGPILFEDTENNLAYGLKAAWLDIGATPYLASLRMDQATTFEEFRDACSFSGLPGENMVWADKEGTIGWQSVGLTPVRFGWDGSLPIPGDGEYEWNGYVPIRQMPHVTNPVEGWYGTANNHNVPDGYPNIFSDFYSDPARIHRLREVMATTNSHSLEDAMALQYDNKSMIAEELAPVIQSLDVSGKAEDAQRYLASWDHFMDRDSVAAAIYDQMEIDILRRLKALIYPPEVIDAMPGVNRDKMREWLVTPPEFIFGENPEQARDIMMAESLHRATEILEEKLGPDMADWVYGATHMARIIHPFSDLVDDEMRAKINIAPLPRGGAGNTLNANHSDLYQRSGASFRLVVDTSDWDLARGTNAPGQSGDPASPFYGDLFKGWNRGDYFPVLYSRDKIEEAASQTLRLEPN